VRAWEEAEAIRAYCGAVERRHGHDAIAADPDAPEWLAFALEHADHVRQLPRMPPDSESTHERLKPCLGSWSPIRPNRWSPSVEPISQALPGSTRKVDRANPH